MPQFAFHFVRRTDRLGDCFAQQFAVTLSQALN